MSCGRRRAPVRNCINMAQALNRRKSKPGSYTSSKCIKCGKSFPNTADPMVPVSFFNVLYSTIFMKNKYKLNNLPSRKRALFDRYCNQYAYLFLCSSCIGSVKEVQDRIYRIYVSEKKIS